MTKLHRSHRTARCPFRLVALLVLLPWFGSGARETLAAARLTASSQSPQSHSARVPDACFFLECDRGQLADGAVFRARGLCATVLLDGDGLAFAANGAAGGGSAVRLSFGGVGRLAWEGRESLTARGSSFVGSDPAAWRTGIPLCAAAVARAERTGVEIRFGGDEGRPAYSFHVPAGSNEVVPTLRFDGASSVDVDRRGDLVVAVPAGRWTHSAPRAFEETTDGPREVPCRFVAAGSGEVRIEVERRDRAAALFVDPRVDFADTHGIPVWQENVSRVSVDAQGGIAVAFAAGECLPRPYRGQPLRSTIVVLRLDATGRRLRWTTTIGSGVAGAGEGVGGIVARDSGAVLVAGNTCQASHFPRVDPVLDFAGYSADAFVCQIATDGASLEFSSIYGGWGWGYAYEDGQVPVGPMGDDCVSGACVASDGTIVVVGMSDSVDLPVVGQHGRTSGGAFDGFVLRLAPDGKSIVHAGCLGGAGWDYAWGVAAGPDGSVCVAGPTGSADFPLVGEIPGASGTGDDAFVTRMSASGEITWSTKLGGSYDDAAGPVAVAKDGTVYVAGRAAWTDFPAAGPGPFGPRGRGDLFVAHLDPVAHAVLQSVVIGGGDLEDAAAMCIDPSGRVWLTGDTDSGNFPVLDAVSSDPGGSANYSFVPFVAVFSSGCDLVSSGYVWGAGYGLGGSIAAGGAGLAWLGGLTFDANFPFTDAPTGAGVENGHAYLVAAAFGPDRPKPVTATTGPGSATFSWGHDGEDVAGFVVERSADGAPFQVISRPAGDVRSVAEKNLLLRTALVYRVRAVGPAGDESRWSDEAAVTVTLPTPMPAPPSGLTAVIEEDGPVRLSWTDASDDEDWFQVERTRPGGPAALVAQLAAGTTTWTDDAPAADRGAVYRVRSGNFAGPSRWSDAASVATPATLLVTIDRGTIVRHGTKPKGSVRLRGSIVVRADGEPYDARAGGLTVHLEGWDGPVLVDIPAGDAGWKRRRGVFTWRTPRRARPCIAVKFAPATGSFVLDVTRVVPPAIEPGLVRISAGNAADGGSDEREWHAKGRALVLR